MIAHQLANDLRPILSSADRVADRFCRRHAVTLLEQDDVRQDLLLDLLTRLKAFDRTRSTLTTFAAMCFKHRIARLGIAAGRENLVRHPVALDAALPGGEGLTFLDTISDEEGYGAWVGHSADLYFERERHLDLDRALSAIGPAVVQLCATILDPAQRRVGMSRATVHRRVRELRCQLLAAGVAEPVKQAARPVGI